MKKERFIFKVAVAILAISSFGVTSNFVGLFETSAVYLLQEPFITESIGDHFKVSKDSTYYGINVPYMARFGFKFKSNLKRINSKIKELDKKYQISIYCKNLDAMRYRLYKALSVDNGFNNIQKVPSQVPMITFKCLRELSKVLDGLKKDYDEAQKKYLNDTLEYEDYDLIPHDEHGQPRYGFKPIIDKCNAALIEYDTFRVALAVVVAKINYSINVNDKNTKYCKINTFVNGLSDFCNKKLGLYDGKMIKVSEEELDKLKINKMGEMGEDLFSMYDRETFKFSDPEFDYSSSDGEMKLQKGYMSSVLDDIDSKISQLKVLSQKRSNLEYMSYEGDEQGSKLDFEDKEIVYGDPEFKF